MQEERSPNLSEAQIKELLQFCEYTSHLMFPDQCSKLSEEVGYHSLMRVGEEGDGPKLGEREVEKYQEELAERATDFLKMCVQLFYLILNSAKYGMQVQFHEELVVYSSHDHRFMLPIKELIPPTSETKGEPTKVYFPMYVKAIGQVAKVLDQSLYFLHNKIKSIQEQTEMPIESKIDDKDRKLSSLALKQSDIKTMLRPLSSFVSDAQEVAKLGETDHPSFLKLEKSQFMHQHSMLYRIRNRSITIVLFRKNKPECLEKLRAAILTQKKLCKRHDELRKGKKAGQKEMEEVLKKIQGNFEKYVQEGWSVNPVYIKLVQPSQGQLGEDNKMIPKFSFKTKVKTLVEKFEFKKEEQKGQTVKDQVLEYSVDFLYGKPNMIVRLHTPIVLDEQNLDVALHNWNALAFNAPYSSLQLGEKSPKLKYIIIKSINEFNHGESVICQYLRLMDLTMVAYQVIESKVRMLGRTKDTSIVDTKFYSNSEVVEEIKHYSLAMTEIAYRLYNSVE